MRGLGLQFPKARQSAWIQDSFVYRLENSAARLSFVPAIAKATTTGKILDVRESLLQASVQIPDTQFPHARRV
jgi:hypothetical protein